MTAPRLARNRVVRQEILFLSLNLPVVEFPVQLAFDERRLAVSVYS